MGVANDVAVSVNPLLEPPVRQGMWHVDPGTYTVQQHIRGSGLHSLEGIRTAYKLRVNLAVSGSSGSLSMPENAVRLSRLSRGQLQCLDIASHKSLLASSIQHTSRNRAGKQFQLTGPQGGTVSSVHQDLLQQTFSLTIPRCRLQECYCTSQNFDFAQLGSNARGTKAVADN